MAKKKEIISDIGLKNIEQSIENLDKNNQDIAKKIIDEIKFCSNTLEELKQEVRDKGAITEMEQGSYSIERENPALKSYNTTIKNYQNLLKQLAELFADLPPDNKPDELEAFCK